MSQVNKQRARRLVAHSAIGLLAAAIMLTGCRSRKRQPGLLGPRAVIPAPYVEPGASATGPLGPPAEPSFDIAPMTPPGVDLTDDLVQPADFAEPAAPAMVPVPDESDAVVLPPEVQSQKLTYTVKKGDSLWEIGQIYGVTIAELAAENNMNPDKILHPGDVLRLPPGARRRDPGEIERARKTPAKATTPSAPKHTPAMPRQPIPADGVYTVKAGDNLWTISRRFGVKSQDIIAWNNLNTDVLQIGQKLKLRGTASIPAAPTRQPLPTPTPTVDDTDQEKPDTGSATSTPQPPTEDRTPEPDTGETVDTAPERVPVPGALDLPKKLAHTVTEGETLQIIADMYGTTVNAIKNENPSVTSDADLQPNLKLMVPYR